LEAIPTPEFPVNQKNCKVLTAKSLCHSNASRFDSSSQKHQEPRLETSSTSVMVLGGM
jgi:hypothetical protein